MGERQSVFVHCDYFVRHCVCLGGLFLTLVFLIYVTILLYTVCVGKVLSNLVHNRYLD